MASPTVVLPMLSFMLDGVWCGENSGWLFLVIVQILGDRH
ncbi:Unknown protein sequence [Pseudomonas syringae pv. maculicola]|nr:Unknown protein sequence [Pseudomonas syringae pv. maculicola]